MHLLFAVAVMGGERSTSIADVLMSSKQSETAILIYNKLRRGGKRHTSTDETKYLLINFFFMQNSNTILSTQFVQGAFCLINFDAVW